MMMLKCWCVLMVFTALLQIARGEDYSERDDDLRQAAAGRGMREDFGVDQWKAVQRHQMDSSGWIASDSEEQQPRRRLRKRKRRPEATPEVQSRPRRRRPVSLDEARDTWKELEAETPKRTYKRRRISPVYLPQLMTPAVAKFEEERDGNGRKTEKMQEANERMAGMGRRRRLRTSTTSTTTNSPASVVDIKNLIKQNGGMSLSEILQKRNLSLTDLLKGKQQAISALSGNAVKTSQKHLSTKLFENHKIDDVQMKVKVDERQVIDHSRQSKKPLKLIDDQDRNTERPVKNWRLEQNEDVNRFKTKQRPVKLENDDRIQTEKPLNEDKVEKRVKVIGKQTEDDGFKQSDRPMMLNDGGWKQTDKPLKATVEASFKQNQKVLDWRQTKDDSFEQSEQPVKMTNAWGVTENPLKVKLDWRDEYTENPVDWGEEQTVKPTKVKVDWRDEQTENPIDWGEEHTAKPSKVKLDWKDEQMEIDALRQSDEPVNNWRQAVNVLDLMQPKQPNEEDVLEEQRKRYKNSGHKIYSDVMKLDVVTEPTTDKRIFVPSHPKYYTSLNYKPDFGMEQMMRTTTMETPVTMTTFTTRKSKLPITSAKLLHSAKKETLPPKVIKISISDILGFKSNMENDTKNKEDAGPLKMLFDLEELVKQDFDSNTVTPLETTSLGFTSTKYPELEYTTELVQEKMSPVSAKDEIMEILKDEYTKQHLSKILEVRNMTVDELVEQRERGSSQRHLADIFHNKTKEPEPVVEHVGEIKVARKGKTVQQEIDVKTLPDVSISSEEVESSERIVGTSFPTYKIETNKMQNPPLPIPVWKTIYPSTISKEVVAEEIPIIEEIENTISEAVNEELSNDLTKTNYDYDEYVQLPLGVKSAIFASLAIIGISLIVFLTILIIFKWAQRQKQRLCYPGTFKSPILQSDSRRSIRTFVSETLGRKKSVYTSRLQSMSDSWDGDKPYQ